MKLTFAPRGVLQIDDARIIWRNFAGKPTQFTREGERYFTLVIPNSEICEALMNDVNRYGVPWNVKIKEPRTPDEEPFMTLKVKVKFTDFGPRVYLKSGDNPPRELNEETIGILDNVDIMSCDLDIRPYDDEANGKPFRAAYLQSIHVVQNVDRFAARYAEEECPDEY